MLNKIWWKTGMWLEVFRNSTAKIMTWKRTRKFPNCMSCKHQLGWYQTKSRPKHYSTLFCWQLWIAQDFGVMGCASIGCDTWAGFLTWSRICTDTPWASTQPVAKSWAISALAEISWLKSPWMIAGPVQLLTIRLAHLSMASVMPCGSCMEWLLGGGAYIEIMSNVEWGPKESCVTTKELEAMVKAISVLTSFPMISNLK